MDRYGRVVDDNRENLGFSFDGIRGSSVKNEVPEEAEETPVSDGVQGGAPNEKEEVKK
jgi:hypothetical protein